MKPQTRRCSKCGELLIQTETKWVHILNKFGCRNEPERFIRKEDAPLFLNVKADKETKKFLEDIMQETPAPLPPRRSWYFGGPDFNLVFVRTEGKRFLDVYNKDEWAKILAKEIKGDKE